MLWRNMGTRSLLDSLCDLGGTQVGKLGVMSVGDRGMEASLLMQGETDGRC